MTGGGASVPPYLQTHSGPCLVVGNAACLPDDLERARSLFPNAPAIAINDASRELKAFALFSFHPERFIERGWIDRQRRLFGPDFTVHSVNPTDNCPHVHHWWPDAKGSGGSAWGARKVAGFMGFSPVILVGCPLTVGPYTNGSAMGGYMHVPNVVDDLLRGIEREREWHDGCFSMSGRTKDLLGSP